MVVQNNIFFTGIYFSISDNIYFTVKRGGGKVVWGGDLFIINAITLTAAIYNST